MAAAAKAEITARRLRELAEAGLRVFCREGYERSQVADVAKAMGVAVGTVYSYVEGKEALFDLVVRHAFAVDSDWLGTLAIPVATPSAGSTLAFLQETFGRTKWPVLAAALKVKVAADPLGELRQVLKEQYRLMHSHRLGLLLLRRSALEFPGLAGVFVLGLRANLLDQLSRYIKRRVKGGQFRGPDDIFATAAVIIQTIAWSNLQRPDDLGFAAISESAAENATVEMLANGLILK